MCHQCFRDMKYAHVVSQATRSRTVLHPTHALKYRATPLVRTVKRDDSPKEEDKHDTTQFLRIARLIC